MRYLKWCVRDSDGSTWTFETWKDFVDHLEQELTYAPGEYTVWSDYE